MEAKIACVLILVFICNLINGQAEYRRFEVITGDENNCAKVRFWELNRMIYSQDFAMIKYIYPKIDEHKIKELEEFSNTRKLYSNTGLSMSGAARIECDNCERIQMSHLIYSQNKSEIDDLIALTMTVEREPPFFIESILINDTLSLSEQVRSDLLVKNIIPYPPMIFPKPGCFGTNNHFRLKLDRNNNAYLDGLNFGDYIIGYPGFPEMLLDAEKMGIPIKVKIYCPDNDLDCFSKLNNLKNVTELTLSIDSLSEFPESLLSNNELEKLNIKVIRGKPRPMLTFVIPPEILKMRNLKEICFSGYRNRIINVELPRFFNDYTEEITRIKINREGEYVVFSETE